jgi:predicted nucleic acid-binding protein
LILALDTSVVVRLLTGQPPELCAVAKDRLERAHRLGHLVYATDVVLVEAYYAAKYHYGFEPELIRAKLVQMLESGLVSEEPGSGALAALARREGQAGLADRIIHERHRELGAVTLTLDEAQGDLPGAEYLLRR